jgi:hypothetical protein
VEKWRKVRKRGKRKGKRGRGKIIEDQERERKKRWQWPVGWELPGCQEEPAAGSLFYRLSESSAVRSDDEAHGVASDLRKGRGTAAPAAGGVRGTGKRAG